MVRHTPKRQATGSNPAGGAMKKDLAYAKSFFMAPPAGFEPVACRLGVWRTIS